MSRLTYTSEKAFLRSLQMSANKVFVFVEGKHTDRFLYSNICELEFAASGYYDIKLAEEIPTYGGGKKALIRFYKFLKKEKSLIADFKGKKTGIVFYLDKDVENYRSRIKSDHVCYTKYYDSEAHVYLTGNIIQGLSSAASLTIPQIKRHIGNPSTWRRNTTNRWRDWVKICYYVKSRNLNCENYGVASRINVDSYGGFDITLYNNFLTRVERLSGLSSKQFKMSFSRVSKNIDKAYIDGEENLYFKGKWYTYFLLEELKAIGTTIPITNVSPREITVGVSSTVNFDDAWTLDFRTPLRYVKARI